MCKVCNKANCILDELPLKFNMKSFEFNARPINVFCWRNQLCRAHNRYNVIVKKLSVNKMAIKLKYISLLSIYHEDNRI